MACALAPSAAVLIGARALQGIAGALLVPSTLALIVDHFKEHERAVAIGTWTAWSGVTSVVGPLAGGVLIQVASWRWIVLLNPIPLAFTVALLRRLPADRRARTRVDWLGGLLCVLGLGGLVFGLINQPTYGWADARVAGRSPCATSRSATSPPLPCTGCTGPAVAEARALSRPQR